MIRRIRFAVVILFIFSIGAYFSVTYYTKATRDYVGPVITIPAEYAEVSVTDSDEKLLAGVTAIDAVDGDVSDSLCVVSMSNFDKDMVREVVIAAFDTKGNVSSASFLLSYSDYKAPRLSLSGPLMAPVGYEYEVLDLIEVVDCLDGEIEENVSVTTERAISADDADLYQAKITASNSAGDTVEWPVTIETYKRDYRNQKRELELSDYVVYTKKGKSVDPYEYLSKMTIGDQTYTWSRASSAFEPDEMEDEIDPGFTVGSTVEAEEIPAIGKKEIHVENQVDINTDGIYEITYRYYIDKNDVVSSRLLVFVGEEE